MLILGNTVLRVNVELLTFVVGAVIPLIVGALANSKASSNYKASLNAVLAALSGYLVGAIDAGGILSVEAGVTAFITLVTSWSAYQGYLKHTPIPAAIAGALPGGLGTPSDPPPA